MHEVLCLQILNILRDKLIFFPAKSPSRRSLPNPTRTSSSSSISSLRSNSPLRSSLPAELPKATGKTSRFNGGNLLGYKLNHIS